MKYIFLVICTVLLSSKILAHEIPKGLSDTVADQYETLSENLLIEKLLNDLEKQRHANSLLAFQAADNLRKAAEAKLATAIAALRTELSERRFPDIIVTSAMVFQVSEPSRQCDATPFVEWKCYGGDPSDKEPFARDSCSFTIDESMCGNPSASNQPTMFRVQYTCGEVSREERQPFGRIAHLTCRQ